MKPDVDSPILLSPLIERNFLKSDQHTGILNLNKNKNVYNIKLIKQPLLKYDFKFQDIYHHFALYGSE